MTAHDRRSGAGGAPTIGDPSRRDPRTAPDAGVPSVEAESFEGEHTRAGMGVAASPRTARVERAGPAAAERGASVAAEGGAPVASSLAAPVAVAVAERSEPIRVFSMKDHTEAQQRRSEEHRVPLHVQLRSLAEVSGRNDTPVGLGHLAPPRDPRRAHARRWRANVVWGCVAIVLACVIAVAIWLAAGR